MTRRITSVAAIAAILAFAPAAAYAYEAEDYTSIVSTATSQSGDAIIYVVNGPVYNTNITVNVISNPATIPDSAISIAGTASLTKATDAAGDASFAITLSAPGTYSFTAVDSQGDVIDTQAVTVTGAGGGTTAGGATGTGSLPVTGSSVLPLALGAGALAAAGAGAVIVANKRREGSRA